MNRHGIPTARRPWATVLALAVPAVLVGAVLVPASSASWVDEEFVAAGIGAADCAAPDTVDSTAWGRFLTGSMSGQALEPVAAIDGITVSNIDPAIASSATSASSVVDLGSDAWSTTVELDSLDGQPVGGGETLPFGPNNTGSYTQYGRATSGGLSVGASGAVTSAAGGVVSLETPGSATPRLATLTLSSFLDPTLAGGTLGTTVSQLADVGLRLGAMGGIARYDSCSVLWDRATEPGAALVREYVVDDLGLDFTSSRVTDFTSNLRTTLNSLEDNLDTLLAPGTSITGTALTSITSALTSALNLSVAGVTISLGSVDSVKVGVDFELQPVLDLVTGPVTDGVVTVNLSTGRVSADLAALFGAAYGTSELNGLDPNTNVLTPAVLSAISSRAGTLLTAFVTGTLQPALTAALNAGTVTAVIDATLRTRVLFVNVLGLKLHSTITGSVASFTGVPGAPAPVVSSTVTEASTGILNTLLGLLGINLATLSSAVVAAVVAPLVTTVVPVIGSAVVAPVLTTATGSAASTLTTVTGTTIPAVTGQLGAVLTTLNTLVDITVNARPDQPNPVGSPSVAAPGRYFETALHVGVVNASASTVATLYFGNGSVGPNALR